MAKLNAASHFFSEQISLGQLASEAFGPLDGNEVNQFRTTAKFTTSSAVKAYTVCTGQVFIQPSEISGKINLILRPYKQPIQGLSIKYFIYRGLNKSDFLQTDATKLIGHNSLSDASGFMNAIWTQLKKFNQWTDDQANSQDFLSKWIGFDPDNQLPESFIDDYFFMANSVADDNDEELKPFEFPIIKRGVHLGNFSGTYGLDIVLSDGDYKPLSSDTGFNFDLTYARAEENILNVQSLPANAMEKQYREAIFSFMDPAAYFGLHLQHGKIWVTEGDAIIKKEGQVIYDDFLSKFYTKNNVYIYIQGDLGRSYNYYNNYNNISDTGELFKLGISEDAINVVDYKTNDWPVIIQNQAQTHTESVNNIFIQLAVANQTPLCFGQVANLEEKAENNFLVTSQLLPEQPETTDGDASEINYFTQPIMISVPATSGAGDRLNVSNYIKLLYLGADLTATEDIEGTIISHPIKMIDTIFNPIHVAQRFANTDQEMISWSVSHKNNLVDTPQISEKNSSKIITQTKIIADKLAYTEGEEVLVQNRIIYETQLVEGAGEGLFKRSSANTSSTSSGNFPFDMDKNNFYRLTDSFYMETEIFNDVNETITGIKLKSYDGDLTLSKFLLGLTAIENNRIIDLIEANNIKNASLFLEKKYEGNNYFLFNLFVYGEVNNELKLYKLTEEIKIYTIDNMLFYSNEFSKHMNLYNALDEIIPDFNL